MPAAKFTDAQVEQIRVAHAAGASLRSLAQKHGCHRGTIFNMTRGKSYAKAPGPIVEVGAGQLSDSEIESIRIRYCRGDVTQDQLAEDFGVRQGEISAYVLGKFRREAGGPIKGEDY